MQKMWPCTSILTFNDDHNNANQKNKKKTAGCYPILSKQHKAEILQFNVEIFIYNQVLQYDKVREVRIVCILIFLKVGKYLNYPQ